MISMKDKLGRQLGPEFDDYCFPMHDILCGRLGPEFDDEWIKKFKFHD